MDGLLLIQFKGGTVVHCPEGRGESNVQRNICESLHSYETRTLGRWSPCKWVKLIDEIQKGAGLILPGSNTLSINSHVSCQSVSLSQTVFFFTLYKWTQLKALNATIALYTVRRELSSVYSVATSTDRKAIYNFQIYPPASLCNWQRWWSCRGFSTDPSRTEPNRESQGSANKARLGHSLSHLSLLAGWRILTHQ